MFVWFSAGKSVGEHPIILSPLACRGRFWLRGFEARVSELRCINSVEQASKDGAALRVIVLAQDVQDFVYRLPQDVEFNSGEVLAQVRFMGSCLTQNGQLFNGVAGGLDLGEGGLADEFRQDG